MKKIRNISFTIEEGYIEFDFTVDVTLCTAQLQLPDTPDSEHFINDIQFYSYDDSPDSATWDALCNFYYKSFPDKQCAAASAELRERITSIEEVYDKEGVFFVATNEDGDTYVLKESNYADYYNVTLFDAVPESLDYEDIIRIKTLAGD